MKPGGISIDRRSSVPLHRQLERAFRDAILGGRLQPGDRILSSRELCVHLGLARNTILDALGQLEAEGYLVTTRGVGTFVAESIHRVAGPRGSSKTDRDIAPSTAAVDLLNASALAAKPGDALPFRPGVPDLESFPLAFVRRCFNGQRLRPQLLDYSDISGDEHLREAIAERLQQTRGIACTPDEVLITSGAQAAFSLIARVLLGRRDAVAVEDPGYPNARAAFSPAARESLRCPSTIPVSSFPPSSSGPRVAQSSRRRISILPAPCYHWSAGSRFSIGRSHTAHGSWRTTTTASSTTRAGRNRLSRAWMEAGEYSTSEPLAKYSHRRCVSGIWSCRERFAPPLPQRS